MATQEAGFEVWSWAREIITGVTLVLMGWLYKNHDARRKAVDVRLDALEKCQASQQTDLAVVKSCQENTREILNRLDQKIDTLIQASLDRIPGGKRKTD